MSAPATSRRPPPSRGRRPGGGRVASIRASIRRGLGRIFAPVGRLARAVTSGDKPFVVGVIGVLVLGVVLLSGPMQSYLDHRARVDVLEMQVDVLEGENEKLAARADALLEDETVELLAREQQGFIRPGEVPYALTPPEVDRPRITVPRDGPAPSEPAWYERTWNALQSLFGS